MAGCILGHSQPQTTYSYLSAFVEATKRAAASLEAFQAKNECQVTTPELIN
jgi:hypothetical protein